METNLPNSRCLPQQNAKQHDGSRSRCDPSSTALRDEGRKAQVERQNRAEQEVKARRLSLRAFRLTARNQTLVTDDRYGTRFSGTYRDPLHERPG